METDTEELDIVLHSLTWRVLDEAHFEVNMGGGMVKHVPDSDLTLMHPLLALALRVNIRQRMLADATDSVLTQSIVKSTRSLLVNKPVEVIDRNGATYTFSKVFNLWDNASVPGAVCIRGETVQHHVVEVNGDNLPVVRMQKLADVYVGMDFLDTHFPGWGNRWKLSKELDVSLVEQMRHVFDTNPGRVVVTSLTGLSFD